MNFFDKIDLFLFKRLNERHIPTTFKSLKIVFFGGLIVSLIAMLIQMSSMSKDTEEIILGILLIALLGTMYYMVRDTIKAFPVWWKSAIYCVYLFILSVITFNVAMWSFIICLAILVIGLILKIMYPSSGGKKVKIRYSDGTEEEGKIDGQGICGETYVKDKDGNTHVIP